MHHTEHCCLAAAQPVAAGQNLTALAKGVLKHTCRLGMLLQALGSVPDRALLPSSSTTSCCRAEPKEAGKVPCRALPLRSNSLRVDTCIVDMHSLLPSTDYWMWASKCSLWLNIWAWGHWSCDVQEPQRRCTQCRQSIMGCTPHQDMPIAIGRIACVTQFDAMHGRHDGHGSLGSSPP